MFFALYSIFLIVLAVILYRFEKSETTRLVNATWTDFQDVFFSYFTHIGDFATAVAIIVFLLFIRFKLAVIGTACFAFTGLITQFFKKIVYYDIPRPRYHLDLWEDFNTGVLHIADGVTPLATYSFPSGHTTSAFSIFFFVALVVNKKWAGVLLLILAVLAGYSRAYLSHHFLEDVFVGSIIGTFGTLLVYSLLEDKKLGSWGDKSLLRFK